MDELEELENSRQAIINPYENVSSLESMVVDNAGMLSNPYKNIGVATKAAEFQAEEADIALANTLDLLASTGASAGGATALAQAALQSKRGIAQSLEQQEAKNQQLIATGEENLQAKQMSEAQRVQNAKMSEAQRIQQADVLGKEFVYGEKERRETQQLNRKQAQITGSAQAEVAARQSKAQTIGAGVGALGNIAGAAISDRRLKKNIKLIGKSNSGLNIYAFEYINKIFGKGKWQGVMSDEVPNNAIIKNFTGVFDGVDYSKIDVEFKQIN
ncbi:MAG: hypothetical protein ACXADL_17725 [Candidatus Thorarchaeota archaeon]|jgi:hypothetical protein